MKYVITGAASGIGRAVAGLLATKRGADPLKLLLVDRDEAGLRDASSELVRAGVDSALVAADLADPGQIGLVAQQAENVLGGVDGLVSNAGLIKPGLLKDLAIADYEQVFNVNTRATWLLAKAMYPMLRSAKGAVVATASLVSENPAPALGA